MFKRFLSALLICFLFVVSAKADTVQVSTVGLRPLEGSPDAGRGETCYNAGSGQVSFAKFNPALGTLTGVKYKLVVDWYYSLNCNHDGYGVAQYEWWISTIHGIGAHDGQWEYTSNGYYGDFNYDSGWVSDSSISDYIGTGSIPVTISWEVSGFNDPMGPVNVDTIVGGEVDMVLLVEYTYTPAP